MNSNPRSGLNFHSSWPNDFRQRDSNLLKELLERDAALPEESFPRQPQKTNPKKGSSSCHKQWMDKKKIEHLKDEDEYNREIQHFRTSKADITDANYNQYKSEFLSVLPNPKSILDLIRYDYDYKNSDIWSINDIRNFIVQYLNFPKDFDKIASFFFNKTHKDIVNFYFNFKFHFQLVQHVIEVERPKYRDIRKTNQTSRSTYYGSNSMNKSIAK